MALGGGNWVTQNKVLPGSYINVISAASASAALGARGIATAPFALDWGAPGEMLEVSAADLQRGSRRLFGYDYTAPQMRPFRELFRNARLAYLYRLGTGGTAASCDFGAAKYAGERGNALRIAITANADTPTLFDVITYLDAAQVDMQTVAAAGDLADSDFIVWDKTAELTATAGTPLAGGVSPTVTNGDYQAYLDLAEAYGFNAMCCPSGDDAVKALFAAYCRRLRDEQGVKFQAVVYDYAADYEGVVNVANTVSGDGANPWELIWWVTGAVAGTEANRSAVNKAYDGEYAPGLDYTQAQLEGMITGGRFALHRAGDTPRVLADINSLVTVTEGKSGIFRENQTIRVADLIANDIAGIFNTQFLGVMPNDGAGRVALWSAIVQHHSKLQTIRAIEGFDSANVTVTAGDTKKAVVVSDAVTPVNAMAQLYMTVVAS